MEKIRDIADKGTKLCKDRPYLPIGAIVLLIIFFEIFIGNGVWGIISQSKYSGVKNAYIIMILLAIAGIVAAIWLMIKKALKLPGLFLLLGITLGLMYIIIIPPYSLPDQLTHISTAYYYTNVVLGDEAVDADGNVIVREEDKVIGNETEPDINDYVAYYDNVFSNEYPADDSFSIGEPMAQASFILYIPQILGMLLARVLGLGNVMLLVFGRVFALLFYCFCVYRALKWMPFGKMIVFAVALLPISIQQAGSYSYDCFTFALSFPLVAFILHLAYEKEQVKVTDWILLGFMAAGVSLARIIYILLVFLVFLIPKKKAGNNARYFAGMLAVVGIALLTVFASQFFNMMSDLTTRESSVVAWAGDAPGYTLSYFLGRPVELITIFFRSIIEKGGYYVKTMIGGFLGAANIPIGNELVLAFIFILILSVLNTEENPMKIKGRIYMALICLGIIAAAMLSMLLAWTPMSSSVIEGVQGRYFIPVLPLILLIIKNKKLKLRWLHNYVIIILLFLLQYATLASVFRRIATNYFS